MSRHVLFFAVCCVMLAAQAERQPLARYQSIIDRQMFGPLPADFDPTKSPTEVQKSSSISAKELTKEQEQVKSAIRFSVINVKPNGATAVGFTDNSDPKVPVHYYMEVGERRGPWELKEADAEAATMTIVKDGIEVSLSLGADSAKGGGAAKNGGPATARGARPNHLNRPSMLNSASSLRARRQARNQAKEAAEQQRLAEAQKREEERKLREEEERAARDAERAAERAENRKQLEELAANLRESLKKDSAEKNSENAEGDAQ